MRQRLIPIIKKEFTHLIRDPLTLALMVFLPIFMLLIYGYAASLDIKNVPLGVLDLDRTAVSRDFVARFTGSGYFRLVETLRSDHEFSGQLDSGRVRLILNIPQGFGRKVASGRLAEVQALIDGSDPTWAQSALGYVNGLAQAYSQGLVKAVLARRSVVHKAVMPIELVSRIWYNQTLRSINFFIPGLIAIILMQVSATLTSQTIVSEKEQGTMESLVVSPVRKNELMLGKVLPYVIIAFVDIILISGVGYFWFGVPIKGSYLLMLVSSFIFLMGAMGLGVLISTNARSSQEAMQTAFLATMLPSMLLSGFVFPIENMPWVLQMLSAIIPARYYIEILRGIFLKGSGLASFWPAFLFMTTLSTLILAGSIASFKKRIE